VTELVLELLFLDAVVTWRLVGWGVEGVEKEEINVGGVGMEGEGRLGMEIETRDGWPLAWLVRGGGKSKWGRTLLSTLDDMRVNWLSVMNSLLSALTCRSNAISLKVGGGIGSTSTSIGNRGSSVPVTRLLEESLEAKEESISWLWIKFYNIILKIRFQSTILHDGQ
jgi:hypothetical protein